MRAICIVVGLLLFGSFNQKSRKIEGPTITSFTSSLESVINCPAFISVCEFDRRPILNTIAADRDQSRLTYRYSVEAGRIEGAGPAVIWNLENAKVGRYKVTVVVENATGQRASSTLTVNVETCTSCDPPPPPCPTISVECPTEVQKGKRISFVAKVTGSAPKFPVAYR